MSLWSLSSFFFFFNDTATTEIYTLSLHDALPIYHAEQRNGCRVQKGDDRLAAGLRQAERDTQQHGDEEDRHDVTLDERLDKGGRDHRQEEVGQIAVLSDFRRGLDRLGVECGRVGIEAYTDFPKISDNHSDDQGQGRCDLEIDQRLDANICDTANIPHFSDTHDDRGENDRGDDDLDRLDEGVSVRLQIDR